MTDLSPLSERVEAPHRLALPIHPDIALWRPLTADDADEVTALQQAADAVDHPSWTTPREDIVEELGHSYVDLARDSLGGIDADGRIVAWGLNVMPPNPETLVRVLLLGTTHPSVRGAGIGRQLLQWQRGRAQQMLRGSNLPLPGWILQYLSAGNVPGIRLAELLGFHVGRYFATLTRDLAEPVDVPPEPDGVRIVPWRDELSAATLAAKNEAFRDHWSSQPTSAEQWRHLAGGEFFRPDLSFLALSADDPGTVAGLVLTSVLEHDWPHQGYTSSYIGFVATRRPWRGRGVAAALLSRALDASRKAGLEKAVLDVDTQNPSGAVALYTDLGFVPDDSRQVAMVLQY
ncbi:GNAT family N-acetyltransferase [Gryllotalpicola ginsengisoli]|uniref:GNAT family N-acetyltransferase n=1 Tax=Gryllotalpicola ginsengisoli TaxID=444608 RepID=UPI00040C27BF|nr:GNAT family N-acetyltransferase [Gryllotalpicola ginsengisoli]